MLLPALAAAREKARRTACLNNLKEMAIGLESYCSDYGQYFPSWAAYSGEETGTGITGGKNGVDLRNDMKACYGTYKGRNFDNTEKTIMANGFRDKGPDLRPRVICGWRTVAAAHSTTRVGGSLPFRTGYGELNCAPVGLGMLTSTGYVNDVRTLYCPSATNMPADWLNADTGIKDATQDHTIKVLPANIQDIRVLGRGNYDAKTLTHGDIAKFTFNTGLPWRDSTPDSKSIAVLSTYNYRNAAVYPCGSPSKMTKKTDGTDLAAGWTLPHMVLPNARPQIAIDWLGPTFKTQKILGGRAIVSDSWSGDVKGLDGLSPGYGGDPGLHFGKGWFAHKEGYNVLHGDWSAKWYGDPQRRLIYMVQGSGHYPTSYGSLCYAEAGMIGYVTDEASGARCQWSQAGIDAAIAMEDAWMYMR